MLTDAARHRPLPHRLAPPLHRRGVRGAAARPRPKKSPRSCRLAVEYRVALVPQGGNTGLAGGATPDASGAQAVIEPAAPEPHPRHRSAQQHDHRRSRRRCSPTSRRAPKKPARLFPLSLAAEGSCTIGGNLPTNAGGTGVLRYGNTRELCLGPRSGDAARRNLGRPARRCARTTPATICAICIIGAEGTLGIITAAVHEAASGARRARHGARRRSRRRTPRSIFSSLAQRIAGAAADRLRTDVGFLPAPRRPAFRADALSVRRVARADRAARTVGQRKRGARARALRTADGNGARSKASSKMPWSRRTSRNRRRSGICANTFRSRRPRKGSTSSTTSRCRFRASAISSRKPTR